MTANTTFLSSKGDKELNEQEQKNIFRFISLIGSDLRLCISVSGLDRHAIAEIGDAIHNLHEVSYNEFLTEYLHPLVSYFENTSIRLDSISFAKKLLDEKD